MKNVTQSEFRDLLDKLELLHKKIDNRTLVVPFPADEDFDQPINLLFVVDRNRLQAGAVVPGYGAKLKRADALEFCNVWNREKIYPKAYLDQEGDFTTEISLFHDEEISAEYVQNNFIQLSIATNAQFFKELKKFVDEKGAND